VKPPPFDYLAPQSLEEALEVLAERGLDAKVLAGGQSLVPLLNFRLAHPAVLVDLNGIAALERLEESGRGLRLGALVRHATLERDARVADRDPLLAETVPWIAHPQIRNRGTVGGSLAHADPAAELPVWAVARRARFKLARRGGERWVEAGDFFVGLMSTALAPEELLTEVEVPPLAPHTGWAFEEFARRHGDYALMGVAALVTLDGGRCTAARLVYLGGGEVPREAPEAARLLESEGLSESSIAAAAELAANREIEPSPDIHATVAYKRHLAGVLTRRALSRARDRAAAEQAA
jgi:CO/xanthine dehydrogenase FAD-binding subunit